MADKEKRRQAVALAYNQQTDNAPRVVAKGTGKIAERIVEIAEGNKIPVREDAELARALSFLDTGDMIPVELYVTVAKILTEILSLDSKMSDS
ncbi:MAG: EscU/YscU/HrcU family type III secretion system export apparatus switch protein [Clostridiales bacterium]|jgi:flagellar biosynthesis protein|nr:EscU/YscU/HrcU family type III secretion system export apparatus switch protein [Clostridiales bacterium]